MGYYLGDRKLRPLRQFIEILVGNNGCDLDDRIVNGVEPGHLQVDPNQMSGLSNITGRFIHARSLHR